MKHLLLILSLYIGISSKAQDTIMPTIGELYNFDIGDVFEYKYLTYNYDGNLGVMVREYTIKTVIDKWFMNENVHYRFSLLKERYWQNPPGYGTSYSLDTIEEIFGPIDSTFQFYGNHDTVTQYPCSYCHVDSIFVSSEFHGRKMIYHYQGDAMSNGYSIWGEGIGWVKSHSFSEDWGSGQGSDELIYYKKANGETWGAFYGIDYVGIKENESDKMRLTYTNSGVLEASLPTQPNSNAILTIYNLTGQIVSTYLLESKLTNIDLGMLPKGIYLWQLQQEGKAVQNGKLLTQ